MTHDKQHTWQRTVTYEVTAPDLETALEVWEETGPEIADDRRISAHGSSNFELVEDPQR